MRTACGGRLWPRVFPISGAQEPVTGGIVLAWPGPRAVLELAIEPTNQRYSPEMRERATRMLHQSGPARPNVVSAVRDVAGRRERSRRRYVYDPSWLRPVPAAARALIASTASAASESSETVTATSCSPMATTALR